MPNVLSRIARAHAFPLTAKILRCKNAAFDSHAGGAISASSHGLPPEPLPISIGFAAITNTEFRGEPQAHMENT